MTACQCALRTGRQEGTDLQTLASIVDLCEAVGYEDERR